MRDENIARGHLIRKLEKLNQRVVDLESMKAELKQVQELLQKERETFFPILHKAPYGIALIDNDGTFIYINPAFTEITGYNLEDIFSGGDWFHRASPFPEYREQIISSLKRDVIQKGVEKIFSVVCKNGEMKEIEFKPTLLDDGRMVVILFDITERKRAEEALRHSEEQYRLIAENTKDLICTLDLQGNFHYVSPSFKEVLGYSPEELRGLNAFSLIHPGNREALMKIYQQALIKKEAGNAEFRYRHKNGNWRFFESVGNWIFNGNGTPRESVIVSRDITERKQAEEKMAALQVQLGQSQKMEAIGRLAGGIAHDFNNILAVIQGYSDLCLSGIPKENPLREDIQAITNAVKRAANLISQLLAFSRRQTMEMEVINLNPLLQNLEKMLRRVIGEDVELVTTLPDDLGRVKADPGQIEQILLNLAVNARDAMPSGGKLTIETANVTLKETNGQDPMGPTPGHYVMISIGDTGLGMTQEVKERIFEPFFTTKEIGKGTGLGLSMVYGIVQQSGGHIGVDSEPGEGATFRIYLPRVDEPVVGVDEKEIGELPLGNETILVVEDEEEVRKLVARSLKKQGYNVLEASQGKEVFSLCEEQGGPIHLMVTDVVMPEMTGVELAKRIKQVHPGMKVLYMSGYTLDRVAIDCEKVEKGIEFIRKPFTAYKLTRKIREVLDKQSGTA
jgi:two-component system cell cycle sensor histidine kinase/response regulator CckA